jgi:acyl-CoA thioesterase
MTTASTGPHQFAMEGWISTAPFEKLLNIAIVDAEDGRATLTMPFFLDYANGAGIMHGGALVSLADTAVVMAIKTLIPPQSHFATTRLETNFLHPVKKGIVTAKAEVVSRVDRIIEGRAVIYDDEERAVMEYLSTFKIARDTQIRGITFAGSGISIDSHGNPKAE